MGCGLDIRLGFVLWVLMVYIYLVKVVVLSILFWDIVEKLLVIVYFFGFEF